MIGSKCCLLVCVLFACESIKITTSVFGYHFEPSWQLSGGGGDDEQLTSGGKLGQFNAPPPSSAEVNSASQQAANNEEANYEFELADWRQFQRDRIAQRPRFIRHEEPQEVENVFEFVDVESGNGNGNGNGNGELAMNNDKSARQKDERATETSMSFDAVKYVDAIARPTNNATDHINHYERDNTNTNDDDEHEKLHSTRATSSTTTTTPTPTPTPKPKRTGRSMDSRLAHFIERHLPSGQVAPGEHERTEKMASEFGKLYRVISVTNKWASFLSKPRVERNGGEQLRKAFEREEQQQQQSQISRQSSQDEGARGDEAPLTRRTKPTGSGLLVGRLAKKTDWNALFVKLAKVFLQYFLDLILNDMFGTTANINCHEDERAGSLKIDPTSGAYSGLTFTFDPSRLEARQLEQRLHFEHWLAVMRESSSLLYESLAGRAHLAEVRVLIPYKWRSLEWPVAHKSAVMTNRRLRYVDSDVIVGPEDPIYRDTPYAMQHDECGRPGLQIRMPISFLDQQKSVVTGPVTTSSSSGSLDARLKARQFVREFASHRYGIFKESGFRGDFMYPPFSSVAGLAATPSMTQHDSERAANRSGSDELNQLHGFDENWRECKFDTSQASGLPANAQAARCLPYLTRTPTRDSSFNLMSADPFSYVDLRHLTSSETASPASSSSSPPLPVYWAELADTTRWHFCGENFAPIAQSSSSQAEVAQVATKSTASIYFEHNQKATNKQNKMCHEKSALEVIRASQDFRPAPVSPANFNRLPAPTFKFLQEMPPRLIMCFEYTSHLFTSRRLDHSLLEAAINKFLAFDLLAESELATIVFGQHQARTLESSGFQRLDSSLNSRLSLFNLAIDPYEEEVALYTAAELAHLDIQTGSAQQQQQQQPATSTRLLKGSCSFARLMNEVNSLLHKSSVVQYEDVGADVIVLTSGLFIENETTIRELLRTSSFNREQHKLHLIIYPSSMFFDTKSRDGYVILDSQDSEQIIKSRVAKLLTIQRLTGARIHLIKEQLDTQQEVRMSTLLQFYQIFDALAKGHSWDQTNSTMLLSSQQVDSRQTIITSSPLITSGDATPPATPQHQVSFQFELDSSVQNELFVGFIDPRVHHQMAPPVQIFNPHQTTPSVQRAGKRFALKNLELRSPGGQFVFTETATYWNVLGREFNRTSGLDQVVQELPVEQSSTGSESAFFPYRAQLSLAAFHVKPWHLAQLAATKRLAGTWTLSAISDEPLQTAGLAMARANPQGDTLTANCWIQTYQHVDPSDGAGGTAQANLQQLKQVKVFVQAQSGASQIATSDLVTSRMEVHDEMGNIVQNVHMLDDGLGAPDMTQHDGIHSQYVNTRASRQGFYKVMVEVSVGTSGSARKSPAVADTSQLGQDNVCCGSSMGHAQQQQSSTTSGSAGKRPTRQLYCGTFYVDATNRLAQQPPPRISNLTIVNVDQDNRRVTLRWFEPQVDITSGGASSLAELTSGSRPSNGLVSILSDNDLQSDESTGSEAPAARYREPRQSAWPKRIRQVGGVGGGGDQVAEAVDQQLGDNVLIASHQQSARASGLLLAEQLVDRPPGNQLLANRYEIKLFTDRSMARNAFDAKQEVGLKFNDWHVEGHAPNGSHFGGVKEVTLRVPFAREGFYYLAMKVHSGRGNYLASQMSNIVQFYLRNNLTLDEVESIYNQPGMTRDEEGNVYDKNGELIYSPRAPTSGPHSLLHSHSLLKGTTTLDGLSLLVLFSLLAFIMTLLCITLVACLANSARQTMNNKKKGKQQQHSGTGKSTLVGKSSSRVGGGGGSGSASSMVSQSSDVASSEPSDMGVAGAGGSSSSLHNQQVQQHDHLAAIMRDKQSQIDYDLDLQQQHERQQQQAQLIHQQLISRQSDFYSNQSDNWQQQQQSQLQHTVVNGYAYATVMAPAAQQQQYHQMYAGDLNQNGLGVGLPGEEQSQSSHLVSPVQSWPVDILMSHYDKVKQARERNEPAPVMRIETLDQQQQYPHDPLVGLPQPPPAGNEQPEVVDSHLPNYFNQQLQRQLTSVLKSKRQQQEQQQQHVYDIDLVKGTSPALEGVAELPDTGRHRQQPHYYVATDDATHHHSPAHMPPPPQYIYCTPASASVPSPPEVLANGLGTQVTDPSIYSQTTSLQRVSMSVTQSSSDQQQFGCNYYANSANNTTWQDQQQAIYGSQQVNQVADQLASNQQQAGDSSAISEV